MGVVTGLEVLLRSPQTILKGDRVGLLCHQASVTTDLVHAKDALANALGDGLRCLFSPQHGLYAEKQDNMVESHDCEDDLLGIPVYSLYGERREPNPDHFSSIDCLLVDLQDVGARVYTYVWTMFLAMKVAEATGRRVVVLDRPNPIGGLQVEGNKLSQENFSFVGMAPIPMRHGMTMGELAMYFRANFFPGLDLEVVKMEGWRRSMYFDDTGLPWVMPSPNMPTLDTAIVYPGQVLLEGTNLSEGRGTTRPFEIFGAPYVRPQLLEKGLEAWGLSGFRLRFQPFEPTFNKWKGSRCLGFQVHVTDRKAFRPYRFTLAILSIVRREFSEEFEYASPPYEYEYIRPPIDLLIGDQRVREALESGASSPELASLLRSDEEAFLEERREWLLYGD